MDSLLTKDQSTQPKSELPLTSILSLRSLPSHNFMDSLLTKDRSTQPKSELPLTSILSLRSLPSHNFFDSLLTKDQSTQSKSELSLTSILSESPTRVHSNTSADNVSPQNPPKRGLQFWLVFLAICMSTLLSALDLVSL